jgi:hypothetical protein
VGREPLSYGFLILKRNINLKTRPDAWRLVWADSYTTSMKQVWRYPEVSVRGHRGLERRKKVTGGTECYKISGVTEAISTITRCTTNKTIIRLKPPIDINFYFKHKPISFWSDDDVPHYLRTERFKLSLIKSLQATSINRIRYRLF